VNEWKVEIRINKWLAVIRFVVVISGYVFYTLAALVAGAMGAVSSGIHYGYSIWKHKI
jgi:hypothetical protein